MIRVILCSRNGENYIRSQIESILAQNCPELRIMVYDDASSDGTADILREYRLRYPERFSCHVRNEASGSACRSFLKAIIQESGADHYLLCDQDDVWHEDKVTELTAAMNGMENRYGKNVPLLVHSDAAVVDEELNVIADSFADYAGLDPENVTFAAQLIQNRFTGASMMFNEPLRKLVYTLPEHAMMHDCWIGLIALSLGYVSYIDRPLYDYRQHRNNEVGAARDSFLDKLAGRLDKDGASRKAAVVNYENKRLQAMEFAGIYDGFLAPEQKEIIDKFVHFREADPVTRLKLVRKYGFTCSRLHQSAESILL